MVARPFCVRIVSLTVLLTVLPLGAQNQSQPASKAAPRPVPGKLPSGNVQLPGRQTGAARTTPRRFKSPAIRKLLESAARPHGDLQQMTPLVGTDLSVSPFLTTPPMYAAGSNPRGVALADFNSDGRQDIILAANPPMLLLGNGDGTFQTGTPLGTLGSAPTGVAVADFNHDGALDLAFSTSDSVVVFLGNGNGTFQAGVTLPAGGSQIAAGDFNNDGRADLILATGGGISVFLGNGNGTFQTAKTTVAAAQFMAIADFNNDGRLDLAVTDGFSSLTILLGGGDGTFSASGVYFTPVFHTLQALAVADFNRDGSPDVAMPDGEVFLGNGDGTLRTPGSFQVSPGASVVSTGDLNGDGIADLVTAGPGENCGNSDFASTGVSIGNGDGTFQPVRVFDAGGCSFLASLAMGDLNGDGVSDVVVVSGQESLFANGVQLSVLLNRGSGTFPAAELSIAGGSGNAAVADFNRDGNADLVLADGSVYLGNGDGSLRFSASAPLGAIALITADFNHDGKPDIAAVVECAPAGCSSGGRLETAQGNGDGTFKPVRTLASRGFYPEALAAGDFNGDGIVDIAVLNNCTDVACSGGGSVSLFFGTGNGTFHYHSTITLSPPKLGGIPVSMVAGDFNNDGILDLAVVGPLPGPFGEPSAVSTFLGNGDGSFQTAILTTTQGPIETAAALAADFNGDGILDLVLAGGLTCSDCSGHGTIIYGNGDGTFATGRDIGTQGGPPVSVAVADFFGNGTLTSVFANRCGDALDCPGGSVMIDGTNNITDIMLAFLVVGDFNNDGKPDLAGSLQFQPGASVLLNVGAAAAATTMTLSPSAQQSYAASQPVTLTAQVQHTGPGAPTNRVKFFDGAVAIGSAVLDGNGQALLTTAALTVGPHFIVSRYSGDGNFAASNSLGVRLTVEPATTATVVSSSANPAYPNQTVTFTANVTSQFGGALSGNVVFKQGKTIVATLPLSDGQAAFTTTYTTPVVRQITAMYSGDSNNLGSTSAVLRQFVNKLPAVTATNVTTSASPAKIGQAVTFTATTTSTLGPIPDGEIVTFYNGATAMGTGRVAAGVATFTTSSLPAATRIIRASYPGDGTFKASSGTTQQIMNLYLSTTTLTSSANPSTKGHTVTLTATVGSSNPKIPTGRVTFKNGTQGLGTVELTATVARLHTTRLPVGMDSIVAVYSGDARTGKSTSPVVKQTVN
jgi:hypothetical protein